MMEKADELVKELETAEGHDRIVLLIRLSEAYLDTSLEQSREYCRQALILSEELDDKEATADVLNKMGIIFQNIGDYDKALECQQQSLNIREGMNDRWGIAKALNNIGNAHLFLCNYDRSLEYYFKSLKMRDELGDKKGIAANLNNIGLVYSNLNKHEKALEYQLKSLSIEEELGDKRDIAGSLMNIGIAYRKMGRYQDALQYYVRAYKLYSELEDKYYIANSLNNIGVVYENNREYAKSLEHFKKALELYLEIGNKKTIAGSYNNIGNVFLEQKNYAEALKYLELGVNAAGELNSKDLISDGCRSLSDLHTALGDYRAALDYYKKYSETKDSIFTEDSSKKIAEMQTKYETEKKEKEAEIYRLRNVELAEANQAITQAKEIIEEKNRHITSSIEYARRIQQAVLPPAGKMQAALPNHFVLFKPRDIVSGDFYWFSQTGGKILIAVVDCTGHGVPGAFMSMIGSMLLNTIVNENGETDPAKVLEQLHVAVRSALKQHDAEADTTDGMDVCLCAIEQGSKRLVYTGAKRPLYLVRNNELTEIAGDGKSIGGRQKEEKRAFSEKQIELQDGDMLYLTSDGYSDQCNPEGRKIGSRRLKELLTEISGHNPSAQREALLAELDRHQGTEEQRDDIAVMGVRL